MRADGTSVSVVVPAYNEETRIAATLASIFAQTQPPLEIVVIDDGSTDRTAEIAARAGVRVVSQPNAGISAARNRGFAESRGDYVALLDADDLWLPERLAWFARARDAAPDAAFHFADHTVDERGVPNAPSHLFATKAYRTMPRRSVSNGIVTVRGCDLARALASGNFLATSTIVVRRDLVARGVMFDERLPLRTAEYQLSEDVEWYLRVLRQADAAGVERVLSRYVRTPGRQASAHAIVRHGDVMLGEWVARTPERYADGTALAFRSARRAQQRHVTWLHAGSADFVSARRVLGRAQRERYSVRDACTLAALRCADVPAGRAALHALRAAWRGTLRPALRAATGRIAR